MNYVTISDLKKQAKKERKNNTSIKNHAESLNIIAKKNKFDNWTDLIDAAVLIKQNDLNEYQKIELLTEFLNESITLLNEFKLIFRTDNYEMLSIFINKHFLSQNMNQTPDSNLWKQRARKWMECVCFIFLNSDLPRNINEFRNCFVFENMLDIIDKKNLYQDDNVKCLFNMLGYEINDQLRIEPKHEVLEQNGFCAMQYTECMGFIADGLSRAFNNEFEVTKNKLKKFLLENYEWFTYDYFGSTNLVLDKKKLLTQYKNSFKNEQIFKENLKFHLGII